MKILIGLLPYAYIFILLFFNLYLLRLLDGLIAGTTTVNRRDMNFLFLECTAKWRRYTKNRSLRIVVRAMEKPNRIL